MKDKTFLLIMDGFQASLVAIMLVLLTVWIIAHLNLGNFNFVGFTIAAAVWCALFRMLCGTIREYKAVKSSTSENE